MGPERRRRGAGTSEAIDGAAICALITIAGIAVGVQDVIAVHCPEDQGVWQSPPLPPASPQRPDAGVVVGAMSCII